MLVEDPDFSGDTGCSLSSLHLTPCALNKTSVLSGIDSKLKILDRL